MAVVQRRCEPNISLVSRGQSNARLKARPHLLRIHRLTLFAPSIVDDSETQAVTVMIAGQLMNSDHGLYPHSGPQDERAQTLIQKTDESQQMCCWPSTEKLRSQVGISCQRG